MKHASITLMLLVSSSLFAGGDLFTNYDQYAKKVPLEEKLRTKYGLKAAQYQPYLEYLSASAHADIKKLKEWYNQLQNTGAAVPKKILQAARSLAKKSYHENELKALEILDQIGGYNR